MSNLEKLNALVGIVPKKNVFYIDEEGHTMFTPPLTYPKQFKILKLLAKRQVRFSEYDNAWYIQIGEDGEDNSFFAESNGTFEEVLSYFLVNVWDKLSVEEQNKIKEIMNGRGK